MQYSRIIRSLPVFYDDVAAERRSCECSYAAVYATTELRVVYTYGAGQHARGNECCTTHSRRSTSPRVARLNSLRKRARLVPRRIRDEAEKRRRFVVNYAREDTLIVLARVDRHTDCTSDRTGCDQIRGAHKWYCYVNDVHCVDNAMHYWYQSRFWFNKASDRIKVVYVRRSALHLP